MKSPIVTNIMAKCPKTGELAWTGKTEEWFIAEWKIHPKRIYKWTFRCSSCDGVHEADSRALKIAPAGLRFQ